MKDSKRANKIVRKLAPPVLTIGASAVILGGAYWLHQKQAHNTEIGNGASNPIAAVNSLGQSVPTNNSAKGSVNPPKTKPTSSKGTGSKESGSSSTDKAKQPGSNHNSGSQNNTQTTTAPQGDIGYTPVTGGTLQDSPDPANLDLSRPFSSIVNQYGTTPETTFDANIINLQDGLTIKLDKSLNAKANQLLVVPLQQGVLWAVIPNQTPGSGTQPTPLYYTVYGQTPGSPSTVVLSPSAQRLGDIPVSTTGTALQTSWYQPTKPQAQTSGSGNNTSALSSQSMQGGGNVTPNSTTNSTMNTTTNNAAGTGTPKNTTATTQNTAFQWTTDAMPGAQFQLISDTPDTTQLFLRGLYQVEGGSDAVITLTTQSNSGTGTWAYLWNEQKQALVPICSVQNTSTDRGWIAIGQQTVYWGQRSLIQPSDQYYKGNQHMMDLATGKVSAIKLGSWTDPGFVEAGKDLASKKPDGNSNQDNLYFRVGRSETWKEFIPAPTS